MEDYGTSELCPSCGRTGEKDDASFIPIFLCPKCEVDFGRCYSVSSLDKNIAKGCNEVTIFRLMDCYSVERQDLSDDLKKQIEESDDGRDTSMFLDENRAQLLASKNNLVSIVEEVIDGRKTVISELRVPSWMSNEGQGLDLGIDNTICSGASTDLVCTKCDTGHFYDIMWDNGF